jgi:hypothetical protein
VYGFIRYARNMLVCVPITYMYFQNIMYICACVRKHADGVKTTDHSIEKNKSNLDNNVRIHEIVMYMYART